MHLEIRHLRLVLAIVDTGSVTKAADRLHLTQSALSHQLRDIEGRLGTPLFERTGKRMVLTAAGERVLRVARGVVRELEQTEADIASGAGLGPEGILRLSTECYTCYHWLPDVLSAYRREHARVEVHIVPDVTRRPLRALAAGDIDVAIVSSTVATRRFRYVPLFEDELVVIAPPGHPLAERSFARPQDFGGQPLVLYTMPDEASTLLGEILQPAGVRPGTITRVQLTEAIIELVKAGFGLATLARWAVAPHLAARTLVAVPLGKGGYRRTWYAAVRSGGAHPDHLMSFVQTLRSASFSGRSRVEAGTSRLTA